MSLGYTAGLPTSLQGEGDMPDLQRAGCRVLTPEALTVILTERVTVDTTGHMLDPSTGSHWGSRGPGLKSGVADSVCAYLG